MTVQHPDKRRAKVLLIFTVTLFLFCCAAFFLHTNVDNVPTRKSRDLQDFGDLPRLTSFGADPDLSVFPLQLCQGDCDDDSDCEGDLICYQRDPNDPVPGCRGGETYAANSDFCIVDPNAIVTPAPSMPNTPPQAPTVAAQPSSTATPTRGDGEDPNAIVTPAPSMSNNNVVPPPAPTVSALPLMTLAPTRAEPDAVYVGNNGEPRDAFPLKRCQSDCDSDGECDWGLYCYQRGYANDPIPGCYHASSNTDVGDADFCVPLPGILPGAFRLRRYWEEGYVWQDETTESFWCVTTHYNGYPGTGVCWYGNVTKDCRSDQTYVARCSGRGLTPEQQAFLLVPISGSIVDVEVLIQTADVNDQRCFERLKREIYLRPCNASNPLQRWLASNGTSFFSPDNKFEITQRGFTRQCVANDHHPKPGEVVELHSCEALRAKDSQSNLWTRF